MCWFPLWTPLAEYLDHRTNETWGKGRCALIERLTEESHDGETLRLPLIAPGNGLLPHANWESLRQLANTQEY